MNLYTPLERGHLSWHDGLSCGKDAVAGVGVVLGKGIVLGERVAIGHHVIIHDGSQIGDDVTIQDHAVVGKLPTRGKRSSLPGAQSSAAGTTTRRRLSSGEKKSNILSPLIQRIIFGLEGFFYYIPSELLNLYRYTYEILNIILKSRFMIQRFSEE